MLDAAARFFVFLARALDVGERRDFGDRHVPPGIVAADALLAVDGNHDHADAGAALRRAKRRLDRGTGGRQFGMRPKRRGLRDETDLELGAIELAGGGAPPVTRAEAVAPDRRR